MKKHNQLTIGVSLDSREILKPLKMARKKYYRAHFTSGKTWEQIIGFNINNFISIQEKSLKYEMYEKA